MADFKFNRQHLDSLTDKLGSFAKSGELSEKEWGLLLAIFAVAADHVRSNRNKTEGTLVTPEVRDDQGVIKNPANAGVEALQGQLRKAYTPGGPPLAFDDRVRPRRVRP